MPSGKLGLSGSLGQVINRRQLAWWFLKLSQVMHGTLNRNVYIYLVPVNGPSRNRGIWWENYHGRSRRWQVLLRGIQKTQHSAREDDHLHSEAFTLARGGKYNVVWWWW